MEKKDMEISKGEQSSIEMLDIEIEAIKEEKRSLRKSLKELQTKMDNLYDKKYINNPRSDSRNQKRSKTMKARDKRFKTERKCK